LKKKFPGEEVFEERKKNISKKEKKKARKKFL